MGYVSTRGQSPPVSFQDAVLAGMAPDGGLYVPESWKSLYVDEADQRSLAAMSFDAVGCWALRALGADRVVAQLPLDVYGAEQPLLFPRQVAPLVQVGAGEWILELFHGPSLSFKDIAMQLIGSLYDHALDARDQRLTVLCATSGDTGGAAVEALRGRERADLFVLSPAGRVSEVQRRFMTASGADNAHVMEIDGDFDACQALVKALFADAKFASKARLSGVNSVNWARIAAQSVYYHVASNSLSTDEPVSFIVPTGNFGDAYSGWVAKQMGARVGRIVLATNANDILSRALSNGRYERAERSLQTLSPAMDIQVASNFERILFEALDRDGDHVRRLYDQFANSGGFDIPEPALGRLRDSFGATAVSDADTLLAIKDLQDNRGYTACPHTAVAWWAAEREPRDRHTVVVATAHPAKFPDTVERATGVRPQLPAKCADLFEREERFDSLPADAEAVKRYIRERSRAWQ
jgi:threonine synthase